MRFVLPLSILLASAVPALAQQSPSPISGPNDAIASPVCALINFGFCPQPPPPPLPFPDPDAQATRAMRTPPPPAHREVHRKALHRRLAPVSG